MTEQATEKSKKGRSPSYPGIPLGTAIALAEKIYAARGWQRTNAEALMGTLGYSLKGGAGQVAYAALKKFGLLDEDGSKQSRTALLSDLARRILTTTGTERAEAIREAALTPTIHRELWEGYNGALPPDQTFRFSLEREGGFTAFGAAEFLSQFRKTIDFAKLDESPTISPEPTPSPAPPAPADRPAAPTGSFLSAFAARMAPHPTPPPGAAGERLQIPIPLGVGAGRLAVLTVPLPMTADEWEHLLVIINANRKGIVSPPASPSPPPHE